MPSSHPLSPLFYPPSLTQSTVLRGDLNTHYINCPKHTVHFLPQGSSANHVRCLQTRHSDHTNGWKWEEVSSREQTWSRGQDPQLFLRFYIAFQRAPGVIKRWHPLLETRMHPWTGFSPSNFHASQYKHPECKTLSQAQLLGRTQAKIVLTKSSSRKQTSR